MRERGSSVKTEFIAGMTTFFAMVYILMVNANMFSNPFGDGSNPLGVSYGAIYVATAISAVVGTVLAGLMANLPLVQASGIGLNAFFVYTVCIGFCLSYANALVLILGEGSACLLRFWACRTRGSLCPTPPLCESDLSLQRTVFLRGHAAPDALTPPPDACFSNFSRL